MDLENIQRKSYKNNERLINNMRKAQNLKTNIVKLSKLSSRNSPTQTPNQFSIISNSQVNQKVVFLSPLTSRDNSFQAQTKCDRCQKLSLLILRQKRSKQQYQQRCKQLFKKFTQITNQKQELIKRLSKFEKILQTANQSIQPYKKNVILMQQQLFSIKDSLINPDKQRPYDDKHRRIIKQFDEKKRTMDFQFDFLKKTHQREQQNNQTKMSRLNFTINYMQMKNKQLENQNAELSRTNKILNGIIHQSGYVVQQRQLFHMASQQLFQLKNDYKKEKKQKQYLTRLVERLKNKIYMLISLIGYGVVSNIQNNDLHDLNLFRNNIEKLNKIQSKLTIDVCGAQSIKNYKSCYAQVKQLAEQDDPWSCLFQPNFLIMFEDQQIKNALQENGTTIIKPQFFLLVRAIFDSKYSQFLIEGDKTNRFQDFTYTFIDFFRLKKNQKRIEINSKRNGDQKDFMKTNFLLRIFDKKVGRLPQIVTFRQFLMKNTPQDQVFYYLMCRNFIYNGPELDNYINCSDPYNFVLYERVLQRVQQILQSYQKSTKTIIFNHLNQKKVMKNKRLLIRANYVIRLLLQVYRKYKKQKVIKLRYIFQQTCKFTKSDFMKFVHFKEILRKNFTYLTNTEICTYYRDSMAIFHTQSQSTFFQAFSASCLQYIFLQQNLKLNQQLKIKINCHDKLDNFNYTMQLIPESVSQIGNQLIYNQYINFIKLKGLNIEKKVKISQFLLKIVHLRLYSIQRSQKQQKYLRELLDQFNNNLIDFINQNFRKRQRYQETLQKASSKIGRQFKKKIYEFYSEFIKDIERQINSSGININ